MVYVSGSIYLSNISFKVRSNDIPQSLKQVGEGVGTLGPAFYNQAVRKKM